MLPRKLAGSLTEPGQNTEITGEVTGDRGGKRLPDLPIQPFCNGDNRADGRGYDRGLKNRNRKTVWERLSHSR